MNEARVLLSPFKFNSDKSHKNPFPRKSLEACDLRGTPILMTDTVIISCFLFKTASDCNINSMRK